MALLFIFTFLCLKNVIAWRECWLSTPYHVIMESYTLIVGVLKYVLFLGVLSALSFILSCFCPVAFLSNFCFFLSAHVIAWWECWLSTTVSCDHRIVHLDCWSIKIFSLFGGFACFEFYPLGLLSYAVFVHFCFSLSTHVIAWRECWLSTPVSYDHIIVHLDCWSIKIFSLFGGFVRFEFYALLLCPMAFLSIFAFLCPPTWSNDENVDCRPLYHMIMGSYSLIVGVLKYFLILGLFVHFEIHPLLLLSFGAFVECCFSLSTHVIAWRECWLSTPVSCDHVIIHLDCWSIKIFSLFWSFVHFEFYPLGLLSYGAFVHFCFSLSAHVIAWRECWLSTPVSCVHRIVHLDCWSIKIFSLWRVLSALSFILWFFCPKALLSIFAFFSPKNVIAWWECWLSTPVSCDHTIVNLDCWSIKIFSLFGVFFRLDFYPSMLLSYGAFVHFCFSLSAHVIAWRQCWLSTPVSCDHVIVHLDC